MRNSRNTKAFLEKHKDKIEVVFLPPYSPKLNHDEWVWSLIKREVGRKNVSTKAELRKAAKGS